MKNNLILRAVSAAGLLASAFGLMSGPTAAADLPVSFKLDVLPILNSRCAECHAAGGEGQQKSGYDLTTYEGVMAGTKYGPMVIPGDPMSSNLVRLVAGKAAPELRMPHNQRPLLDPQIQILTDWVKQGAKDN